MTKLLVFGNSGSGKSSLAKKMCASSDFAHLDLDSIAWLPTTPPSRVPINEAKETIERFISNNKAWVIEGCYGDLIELAMPEADQVIFLNLPIATCIENAKSRPWEPHKYESKQAQDANLVMLIAWIEQYEVRCDSFSKQCHLSLYEQFEGAKKMFTSNNQDV